MSARGARYAAAAAVAACLLTAAAPAMPTTPTSGGEVPSPVTRTADRWADASAATIHPSVYMVTDGAGCTSNFVFEEFKRLADGSTRRHVYLGYAAHCAGKGSSTDTNGCLTGSQPLGTRVDIDGATRPGRLAYSSWHTMVARGENPDSDTCRYNDFALVRIDPADHGRVSPTVPYFGGPTGLGGATAAGDEVYSMGNSSLRQGTEELKPKYEVSLGMQGSGWTHRVYAVTPGIPGDSGSGHMDGSGRAIGVSSTLQALPFAASNGVTDLRSSLDYLTRTTSMRPKLATGTTPFDPQLP